MRLGQLARKVGRRPSEVVQFLASKGIGVAEDSNVRIEDDHALLVIQEFAPAQLADLDMKDEVPAAETPALPAERVSEPEPESNSTPEEETSEQSVDTELIKAPKVELAGLKVLGKIDLPEPKKKAEPPPESRQPERRERDRRPDKPRPRKNPIALQREKEAEELRRKREEEARLKKEQKTRNYHKRVKPGGPVKRMKLVDEPVVEIHQEITEPPKTWVGKFFRWLRT